jgi:hypothetical protein
MTSPTKAPANWVGANIHNDFAPPEAVVPEKSVFDAVDGAHPAALRCHRVVALEPSTGGSPDVSNSVQSLGWRGRSFVDAGGPSLGDDDRLGQG